MDASGAKDEEQRRGLFRTGWFWALAVLRTTTGSGWGKGAAAC